MTYHLCRDYQTNSVSNQTDPGFEDLSGGAGMYVLAAFMRYVLGYTQVGETNFNLNAGPFLIASSTVQTATISTSGSNSLVAIPNSIYTVNNSDLGRMIVLKSVSNPLVNSGCFLITSVNTGTNQYTLSARIGNNGTLISESGLSWFLMENDTLVSGDASTFGFGKIVGNTSQFGANVNPASSATSYAGNGIATTPRIILQSPHSTGWQVRICHEPSNYPSPNGAQTTRWTIAPGFNGNSVGDFVIGAPSLHGGLYFNPNPNNAAYSATAIGPSTIDFSAGARVSIGGDDTGQAVCIIIRSTASNVSNYSYAVFGLPDNEPTPVPSNNIERLFIISLSINGANNNYALSFLWGTGNSGLGIFGMGGLGFGLDSSLCSCSPSLWCNVISSKSGSQAGSPIFSSNAGDSPFLQATELLPVDLVNGHAYNLESTLGTPGIRIVNQQPRTIGTIPFMRVGRANFATYSTTTDVNNSWYHFVNGVFLQWGGPAVVP